MAKTITLREKWLKRTRTQGQIAGRILRDISEAYAQGVQAVDPPSTEAVLAAAREARDPLRVEPTGVASMIGLLLGGQAKEPGTCVPLADLIQGMRDRYRVSRDEALRVIQEAVASGTVQQEGALYWVGSKRKPGESYRVVETPKPVEVLPAQVAELLGGLLVGLAPGARVPRSKLLEVLMQRYWVDKAVANKVALDAVRAGAVRRDCVTDKMWLEQVPPAITTADVVEALKSIKEKHVQTSFLVKVLEERHGLGWLRARQALQAAIEDGAVGQAGSDGCGGVCWLLKPCKQADADTGAGSEGSSADGTGAKAFQPADASDRVVFDYREHLGFMTREEVEAMNSGVDARVADRTPLLNYLWTRAPGWKVTPELSDGTAHWKATVGKGSWKATTRLHALHYMATELGYTGPCPAGAYQDEEVQHWFLAEHGKGCTFGIVQPSGCFMAGLPGRQEAGLGPNEEQARLALALRLGFTWGEGEGMDAARKAWRDALPDRVKVIEGLMPEAEASAKRSLQPLKPLTGVIPPDAEVIGWLDLNTDGWEMERTRLEGGRMTWECSTPAGVKGYGVTPVDARWLLADKLGYKPRTDPGLWLDGPGKAVLDGPAGGYRTLIRVEGDELVVKVGMGPARDIRVKLDKLLAEGWVLCRAEDLSRREHLVQATVQELTLEDCIQECRKVQGRYDKGSADRVRQGCHVAARECVNVLLTVKERNKQKAEKVAAGIVELSPKAALEQWVEATLQNRVVQAKDGRWEARREGGKKTYKGGTRTEALYNLAVAYGYNGRMPVMAPPDPEVMDWLDLMYPGWWLKEVKGSWKVGTMDGMFQRGAVKREQAVLDLALTLGFEWVGKR